MKEPSRPDIEGQSVAEERIGAGELFLSHARFVHGLFARMGAPMSDVPDLVQEVFLAAHRRGGFVPDTARPTTWLAQIAINVLRNARRTSRRRPTSPGEPDLAASPAPSPESELASAEALRRVRACLDELDDGHRDAFVLFELEGMSAAEVALALEVPVGTVYSRIHHARKRFLATWASREEGGR